MQDRCPNPTVPSPHTLADVAEWLAGLGHDVKGYGIVVLQRCEYRAVEYVPKTQGGDAPAMLYVLGDPPRFAHRGYYVATDLREWSLASWSPEDLTGREEYHPFGHWFGLFSALGGAHKYGDRGGKLPAAKLARPEWHEYRA